MSSQKNSVTRAAVIMFLYAALLLTFGILAYLIAPPGANATTAIIATGGCAVIMGAMGIMTMMIRTKRKPGMIGIHLGLVMPLIFAVVFLMRAGSAYRSSGQFTYFESAYNAEVAAGNIADNSDARTAYLTEAKPDLAEKLPEGDKAYLGFILTMLFGVSVAAFVVLLLSRPKLPPKQVAPAAVAEPKASDSAKTKTEPIDTGPATKSEE